MYIVTLTYYPESTGEVVKMLDEIPIPSSIEVKEIIDQKEIERIRETGRL